MEFKKVPISEYGELLFEMDTKAFNREFDYPSDSVASTREYLKNCEVYLLYDGDTVVGTFSYEIQKDKIEIKQILVLPPFQNKGYGKEIMKKINELFRQNTVWMVTHPKNNVAICLYLKSGFSLVGWKDDYYGDGQPRIVLEKKS